MTLLNAGVLGGGTWTVTTPAVAAGAYVAWVLFEIDDGLAVQYVTAPLLNINAPGPGGAIPAPVNTVTWGAVARNAGQQLVGNGNWAKAANWNFSTSEMYCLPVAGGVIDWPSITFAGNGTWSATSNYAFAPTVFYNVVPVVFASSGVGSEITCGDIKLNK